MDFYRGDNRGPDDVNILRHGFTAKPPAVPMNGAESRAFLSLMLAEYKGSAELGFKWRGETPGGLVATAMIQGGGYQGMKYFYKCTIPNDELTLQKLTSKGKLGDPLPVTEALASRSYFLLYNNGSYQTADLIAFCHGQVQSKEATFLTTIPARYIVGYRSGQNTTNETVPFAPFRRPHSAAWRVVNE